MPAENPSCYNIGSALPASISLGSAVKSESESSIPLSGTRSRDEIAMGAVNHTSAATLPPWWHLAYSLPEVRWEKTSTLTRWPTCCFSSHAGDSIVISMTAGTPEQSRATSTSLPGLGNIWISKKKVFVSAVKKVCCTQFSCQFQLVWLDIHRNYLCSHTNLCCHDGILTRDPTMVMFGPWLQSLPPDAMAPRWNVV